MNPLDDLIGGSDTHSPQKQQEIKNPLNDLLGQEDVPSISAPSTAAPNRPFFDPSRFAEIPGDVMQVAQEGIEPATKLWSLPISLMTEGATEKNVKELADVIKRHGASVGPGGPLAGPLVEAAGGLLGTLWSPLTGTMRSLASRPLEEKTGIPKEATEFVLSLAMGRPRYGKPSDITPLESMLHAESNAQYSLVRKMPITWNGDSIASIAKDIKMKLMSSNFGYRDHTAPSTFKYLDELYSLKNPTLNNFPIPVPRPIDDIESIRIGLRSLASSGYRNNRSIDSGAASRAVEMFDKEFSNLTGNDVYSGAKHLPEFFDTLLAARNNWSAYRRTGLLNEIFDKAGVQAASTGTGANIENKLRQAASKMLYGPKSQMYSGEELSLLKDVAEGNLLRETARHFGKLAPSGIVSAAGSALLGHGIGGPKGVFASMLTGILSKKYAEQEVEEAVKKVRDYTAARSELGQRLAARAATQPRQFGMNYYLPYPVPQKIPPMSEIRKLQPMSTVENLIRRIRGEENP